MPFDSQEIFNTLIKTDAWEAPLFVHFMIAEIEEVIFDEQDNSIITCEDTDGNIIYCSKGIWNKHSYLVIMSMSIDAYYAMSYEASDEYVRQFVEYQINNK